MLKLLFKIAIIAAIMAYAIKIAYIQRGYFAVGGEWLLWIWPLLWIAAKGKPKNV